LPIIAQRQDAAPRNAAPSGPRSPAYSGQSNSDQYLSIAKAEAAVLLPLLLAREEELAALATGRGGVLAAQSTKRAPSTRSGGVEVHDAAREAEDDSAAGLDSGCARSGSGREPLGAAVPAQRLDQRNGVRCSRSCANTSSLTRGGREAQAEQRADAAAGARDKAQQARR
jgi:hypothetical protein